MLLILLMLLMQLKMFLIFLNLPVEHNFLIALLEYYYSNTMYLLISVY